MSMENTLVSVIIPIYNSATYMQPCVESVLQQTYRSIEIILVNDGSTDLSEQICKRYAEDDQRVCVITKENGGPGSARNTGLDSAKGELVCFVDCDDILAEEAIEIMVGEINKGFDIVQCRSYKVYADSREDKEFWPCERIELEKIDGMKNYLYAARPIIKFSVWAKLIRKNVIGSLRFSDLRIREDVLFNAYLIDRCMKLVYIPQTLYYVTIRESSVSRSKWSEEKTNAVLSCDDAILSLIESKEEYAFLKSRAWWVKVSSLITLSQLIYKEKEENWQQQLNELKEIGSKWKIPMRMLSVKQKLIFFSYKICPKVFLLVIDKLKNRS